MIYANKGKEAITLILEGLFLYQKQIVLYLSNYSSAITNSNRTKVKCFQTLTNLMFSNSIVVDSESCFLLISYSQN